MAAVHRALWLAVVLAVAPIAIGQAPAPAIQAEATASAPIEVPFELSGNKIYVQVKIRDSGPYWFALDTGSPGAVIDTRLAKDLRIKTAPRGMVGGAGTGGMIAAQARRVPITMGGIRVAAEHPLVIPIDEHLSRYDGRHILGLVGNDTLAKHVVQIDYAGRKLRFHDPETFVYAGTGAAVPIEYRGYTFLRPSIKPEGATEPFTAKFILDTGARLGFSLATPLVKQHGLLNTDPPPPTYTVGYGIGGPVRHAVGRLAEVSLGTAGVERPVATFSSEMGGVFAGDRFEGVLGGELLRRFTVILDYPHDRVIFEKNAAFEDPHEFDMSGLWVSAEGEFFETYQVRSVGAGTPAAEAGLLEGDRITHVDGRPAVEFPYDRFRAILREDGREVVLTVRRGEQEMRVTVRLRRLVRTDAPEHAGVLLAA